MFGVVLAGFLLLLPQQPATTPRPAPKRASGAAAVIAPGRPSREMIERGKQLLELSEAQADGMSDPGVRAFAYLQIARGYAPFDKSKAGAALESAFTATLADDVKNKRDLQEQILGAMAPLVPERAEELLTQVPPDARREALRSLLQYYQKEKKLDRAIEVINRIGQEGEFPYSAAAGIMTALPPEASDARQQLFLTALNAFRTGPPDRRGLSFGTFEFPTMVVRFWRSLPPAVVRQAITEILDQGEKAERAGSSNTLAMSSGEGTASFSSMYQYHLFQLVPILRELDPSAAEDLIKKNQDLQEQLKKYPDGIASLSPNLAGKPRTPGGGGMSMIIGRSGSATGAGRSSPSISPAMLMMQRMNEIMKDAAEHPDQALANLDTLPPQYRASGYEQLARMFVKNKPSLARTVLGRMLELPVDTGDSFGTTRAVELYENAADLYLRLEEPQSARKAIEKGAGLVEKVRKQDTDSDDPNKALKVFWPSTAAWVRLAQLASKVSPDLVLSIIRETPDPDVQLLQRIMLAGTYLQVPLGPTTTIVEKKKGTSMSTNTNEEDSRQMRP